ncbi:transcription initiation factor TFIID subunit 6 [Ectocarpus siliculosus]|uniref:Transcription initiation factor TFIID subunit 6 n=1 Tax=Ectocarpus siliculosus TaxID=2880 RepID=D8LDH0_ECTSI|nr:transcription initiation factor TFIID subunit 6 [Ectocarpus siliculosus]|eukprot:CBN74035.1 transcription initiation factor TFIID subunit 6 [Ectocarpus siliculosus]
MKHSGLRVRVSFTRPQVGEVSEDVLSFLSASAEYHLLDVINDASNFRARGKRSRLTVDDVTASLELRGAEGSLVCSGGGSKSKDSDDSATADGKVDLRKVANATLPVCPIEPGFHMHWLAVDGQQPLLPQNPLPSSGRGKGKSGKRGRGKQGGGGAGGSGGGSSAVRARLSEELTTYLRRCCDAILSRDEPKRSRALASLREDPGLQQLLPHLCTFIQTKVPEYLKRQKEPDQLAALLQMLQCLLNNKNFAFLEIYLDRLLPPLMSCLLHIDFERAGLDTGGSANSDSSSFGGMGVHSAARPKWTHWDVRDYAAELLRAICDKHGNTYPTLQARANDMFDTHVARPKTRLTTLYGAITGVACLGRMPVEQTLGPRVDSLADKISQSCLAATLRRDTKSVTEANQCRIALLRAIGFGTIACTDDLFGEPGLNAERTGRGGEPKQGSSGSGNPAAGGSVSEGGAKNGTSNSSANGAARPSHGLRRRADRLRKRLDRSLYSPLTTKSAAAAAAAAVAGGATGTAADKGKAGSSGGGAEDDDGGSVAADGLDEVIFPWYVVGLRRDGAPQSWWLTNKLSTFV